MKVLQVQPASAIWSTPQQHGWSKALSNVKILVSDCFSPDQRASYYVGSASRVCPAVLSARLRKKSHLAQEKSRPTTIQTEIPPRLGVQSVVRVPSNMSPWPSQNFKPAQVKRGGRGQPKSKGKPTPNPKIQGVAAAQPRRREESIANERAVVGSK